MTMNARMVIDDYYKGNVVLPIDVIGIANSQGIEVFRACFEGVFKEDVFGFIEKNGDNKVRIYVNMDNAPVRRRFTIAHELGHYFLHHKDKKELKYIDLRSTRRTKEEVEANKFAAELLMPEKELREEYEKLMFPTIDSLADTFGVSNQAMKFRLSNLGLSVLDA